MECKISESRIVILDKNGNNLTDIESVIETLDGTPDDSFLLNLAFLLFETIVPDLWARIEHEVRSNPAKVKSIAQNTIVLSWNHHSQSSNMIESGPFHRMLKALIQSLPLFVLTEENQAAHSELSRFLPRFVDNMITFRGFLQSKEASLPSSSSSSSASVSASVSASPDSSFLAFGWKEFLALPDVATELVKKESYQKILRRYSPPTQKIVDTMKESLYRSKYISLAEGDVASPLNALVAQLLVYRWCSANVKAFYANYFALVQTSGSGKTRLALELRRSMYVVYLCVRPENSSGFPPASTFRDTFLGLHKIFEVTKTEEGRAFSKKRTHEEEIDGDGLTAKRQHTRSAEESTRQAQAQQREEELLSPEENLQRKGFLLFFEALFLSIKSTVRPQMNGLPVEQKKQRFFELTSATSFWTNVENKLNELKNNKQPHLVDANATKALIDQISQSLDFHLDNQAMFVFVIDEAREMQKIKKGDPKTPYNFLAFRRALRAIDHPSLFSILLDTSSTVRNFFPRPEDDPSGRVRENAKLYEPFYCFGFLGPWPLRSDVTLRPLVDRFSWEIPQDPQQKYTKFRYNLALDLCVNSRPLFFGTISPENSFLEKAIHLAIKKLLGDKAAAKKPTEFLSNEELLPVICYRYGLLPLTFDLQERLVSSHAALLERMYPESNNMVVRYAPEPMLGESAARIMEKESFRNELRALQGVLLTGQLGRSVSKGNRGEFANMVYMLHMIGQASRKGNKHTCSFNNSPYFSDWTTVRDLLATMSSSEKVVKLLELEGDGNTATLDALVSVTCCFPASSPLNAALLERSLSCRTLFMASPNEEATDFYLAGALRQPVNAVANAAAAAVDDDDDQSAPMKWPSKDHTKGDSSLLHPISYTPTLGCGGRCVIMFQTKNEKSDASLGRAVGVGLKQAVYGAKHALSKIPQEQAVVVSMVFMVGMGKVNLPVVVKRKHPQTSDEVFFVKLDKYKNFLLVIVNGFPGVVDPQNRDMLRTLSTEFQPTSFVHRQTHQLLKDMERITNNSLGDGFFSLEASKKFVEKSLETNFRNDLNVLNLAEMGEDELVCDEETKEDSKGESPFSARVSFVSKGTRMNGTLYFT